MTRLQKIDFSLIIFNYNFLGKLLFRKANKCISIKLENNFPWKVIMKVQLESIDSS